MGLAVTAGSGATIAMDEVGSAGAPVANPAPVMAGPGLYPLTRPVGAVLPMRRRGGRWAGSKGAPVHNPARSAVNLLTLFP